MQRFFKFNQEQNLFLSWCKRKRNGITAFVCQNMLPNETWNSLHMNNKFPLFPHLLFYAWLIFSLKGIGTSINQFWHHKQFRNNCKILKLRIRVMKSSLEYSILNSTKPHKLVTNHLVWTTMLSRVLFKFLKCDMSQKRLCLSVKCLSCILLPTLIFGFSLYINSVTIKYPHMFFMFSFFLSFNSFFCKSFPCWLFIDKQKPTMLESKANIV